MDDYGRPGFAISITRIEAGRGRMAGADDGPEALFSWLVAAWHWPPSPSLRDEPKPTFVMIKVRGKHPVRLYRLHSGSHEPRRPGAECSYRSAIGQGC